MDYKRGIITIGTGAQKYIDMAVYLAMSCRLNSPGIPLALITDSEDPLLSDYFDIIIPANPDYPKGIVHKIFMSDYSPFEETLFIDGDCMVLRDLSIMFNWFQNANVSAFGKPKKSGNFFGLDFNTISERTGIEWIGAINGGVYYFKKNEKAKKVFDKAKDLWKRYDEIGFARLRGSFNEEGLMAVAMASEKELPYDDQGNGMRTPIGQTGQFKMDVLKGTCTFYKNNELVSPAIMHFGGDCMQTFFYKREVRKLKMTGKGSLSKPVISFFVNIIYNIPYIIFVFVYRVTKTIVRGTKFKLKPAMPMYRFE
jgi:hypothetical protein